MNECDYFHLMVKVGPLIYNMSFPNKKQKCNSGIVKHFMMYY